MAKSDIRVCAAWASEHDRPVYTLSTTCPECGAEAVNSAPAPFDPADPYGEYRRRARPDGPAE
jgi:H/ACA ribonucleoprotein complex subunit 3